MSWQTSVSETCSNFVGFLLYNKEKKATNKRFLTCHSKLVFLRHTAILLPFCFKIKEKRMSNEPLFRCHGKLFFQRSNNFVAVLLLKTKRNEQTFLDMSKDIVRTFFEQLSSIK